MSLDGYAAGPGDEVDRLHSFMFEPGGYSDDHTLRFHSTGAIIFGRRTWDLGQPHWGDDTFHAPVVVVTHEALEPVGGFGTTVYFADGIDAALTTARKLAGNGDVHFMGSPTTLQQAIAAGLVDEIDLHLVPLLLGGGTRFFGESAEYDLELVRAIESPTVMQLRYRVLSRA